MSNNVNHPKHYNSNASGVETIEVARDFNFDTGNALKYLTRFRFKGTATEDLNKAVWYLRDFISKKVVCGNVNEAVKQPQLLRLDESLQQNMKRICNAEHNIYVKQALCLIANFEFYYNEGFMNSVEVIDQLEAHIEDIIAEEKELRDMQLAADYLDDAALSEDKVKHLQETDLDRNSIETINVADIPPFISAEDRRNYAARLCKYDENLVDNENLRKVLISENKVINSAAEAKPNKDVRSVIVQIPHDIVLSGNEIAIQQYANDLVQNELNRSNVSLADSMKEKLGDAVKTDESGCTTIDSKDVNVPDEMVVTTSADDGFT